MQYYLEGGMWGRMDAGRWDGFLDWLSDQVIHVTRNITFHIIFPIGVASTH